jgi:hypothetical protein
MADPAAEVSYEAYQYAVERNAAREGTIPHCDSRILHDPAECEYCDRPDLQAVRIMLGIAWTGCEPGPGQIPCEADLVRPAGAPNDHRHWAGNKPTSWSEKPEDWPEESASSKALYGWDRVPIHPFKPTKEEKAFAPWYMKAVCRNDEATTTGYEFRWFVKPFRRWLW